MKRTTTDARWTYCDQCLFFRVWDNEAKPIRLRLAGPNEDLGACFRHAHDTLPVSECDADYCFGPGWGCGEGAPRPKARKVSK